VPLQPRVPPRILLALLWTHPQHCDTPRGRHHFVQKVEALGVELRGQHHNPGDVAARPCQARGETGGDRIPVDERSDNRHRIGMRSDCTNGHIAVGEDGVGLGSEQLFGQRRKLHDSPGANLQDQVAALREALTGQYGQHVGPHSLD
jgi:hypothetical protein